MTPKSRPHFFKEITHLLVIIKGLNVGRKDVVSFRTEFALALCVDCYRRVIWADLIHLTKQPFSLRSPQQIKGKGIHLAEDEGFEPSRLSSTRVRDARTRPLCESSSGIIGLYWLPIISSHSLISQYERFESCPHSATYLGLVLLNRRFRNRNLGSN